MADEDIPVGVMLDTVYPYLLTYGIITKNTNSQNVKDSDLKELAGKWKLKTVDPKHGKPLQRYDLAQSLYAYTEMLDIRRGGRRRGGGLPTLPSFQLSIPDDSAPPVTPMLKNYFGLPPYALNRTAEGIVYQCRKPYEGLFGTDDVKKNTTVATDLNDEMANLIKHESKHKHANSSAQKKVVAALKAMASNSLMLPHFVYRGGTDALLKLSYESVDSEVLYGCASALLLAVCTPAYTTFLVEKQIIAAVSTLIENGDEETKYLCGQVLVGMSLHEGLENLLFNNGVILPLQSLLLSTRLSNICNSMLCVSNVASVMTAGDAEMAFRHLLSGTKRLDLVHSKGCAGLVAQVFLSLSRIPHYVSVLADEGILPVVLTLLEVNAAIESCAEILFNLSTLKKNRRDISNSGVASQVNRLLGCNESAGRAYTLLMTGNLLGGGLFLDKILREDVLKRILQLMDPVVPQQCLACTYVVAHLSQHESSTQMLVSSCQYVSNLITLLASKQCDVVSVGYLLTSLANISYRSVYFNDLVADPAGLVGVLCAESGSLVQQELVLQILINLSIRSELVSVVENALFVRLVMAVKGLFISSVSPVIKNSSISVMTNMCICMPAARALFLDCDLIEILEESGVDEVDMCLKYLTLVYLISCESSLCPKLVDMGAQRLAVSCLATVGNSDHGKNVAAALFHNLSLKRALLGTGVMAALVSFMRNCKGIRVLWATRTIANMSGYPRSRVILAKEPKLIAHLAAVMRTGCLEADKVQHYSAIAICNVLTSVIEKPLLDDMLKSGTIVDVVVVTLLRVNAISTKEVLGKALFNLLSRAEYREVLVLKMDLLEALIELGRIDRVELLELMVQSVVNITCETKKYAKCLLDLQVAQLMIGRTILSPEIQGARATSNVKASCGKAIANLSFDKLIVLSMTKDKIADACYAIFKLSSEENRYCACVTLFNISFFEACTALANTVAVPLLTEAITLGPILVTQLAIGALTNFSKYEIFADQLTNVALVSVISSISSAQLDSTVKLDCLYFIYNLVTSFAPSQIKAAEEGGVVLALVKLVKMFDDETTLSLIGRVIKEITLVETCVKGMLSEGLLGVILKLSKYEWPELKLDLACAMNSLSQTVDYSLKMLKLDTVDILFWLTLHDCLGLYDSIRKYVSRTLRNFTLNLEDSTYLVKEERLTNVIRVLIKSTNDEVLSATSVVIYNLLHSPQLAAYGPTGPEPSKRLLAMEQECINTMLKRGIISMIFDLAAVGRDSVRYLCSASLHCVASHIPDSEDPAVLQLIMCLLDADGELFIGLDEKVANTVPYTVGSAMIGTLFTHSQTGFTASWLPMPVEADNIFQASSVPLECSGSAQVAAKQLGTNVFNLPSALKLSGSDFNNFEFQTINDVGTNQLDNLDEASETSLEHSVSNRKTDSKSHGSGTTQVNNRKTLSPQAKQRSRHMSIQPVAAPNPPVPSGQQNTSSNGVALKTSGSLPSVEKQNFGVIAAANSKLAMSARPAVPDDTLKALQGTHYKPKPGSLQVHVQSSFV